MHKQIHFITDTGADLSPEMLAGRDIEILQMPITIDDNEEVLAGEIDLKEMYDRMRQGAVYKTAQVPRGEFLRVFRRCAQEDTPCVYVSLSSGLSGTFATAHMAAQEVREEYPQAQIEVVDSLSATVGYGRAVLEAYDLAQSGADYEQILLQLRRSIDQVEHLFTVSTLEFLIRGGRLSRAAGAVAGALNIKPILNIDREGQLVAKEKIRGDKRLRQRLAELTNQLSCGLAEQHLYIVHGDASDFADEMISRIREITPIGRVTKTDLGVTIGAHTGPGIVGIVFYNPNKIRISE